MRFLILFGVLQLPVSCEKNIANSQSDFSRKVIRDLLTFHYLCTVLVLWPLPPHQFVVEEVPDRRALAQ